MSRPSKIKIRQILVTLLAVVLLIALSVGIYYWFQPVHSQSTITLTRGDIRATVNANARVQAIRTTRLAFPVSGQIAEVNVQEGDRVRAGDILAALKSDEFDQRVMQSELVLAARQNEMDRALAAPRAEDLEIAQASVKKTALALGLAQDNADKHPSAENNAARESAQADYDIAKANLDRLTRGPSEQDLQALRIAVTNAQIDLDNARRTQEQTKLLAPYDGVVTDVNFQPGEWVGGYNPVIALADTTKLELLAEIDEIDVGGVMPGQNVEVHFDAFPGETLKGQLEEVYPAASNERGAMIYRARIAFDAGNLGIRPGMGATCKIATVEKKDVWLLPARAIKSAGTQKIVTALIDGSTRNLVVQTGLSDGNQTEIISGLEPGIEVVIE